MEPPKLATGVDCYAGYRGEEEPRGFLLGEQRVEVVEILDRWMEPDHRYFKVRGDDGGQYVLRHDVRSGSWDLTQF
jgi:hypothetical protein